MRRTLVLVVTLAGLASACGRYAVRPNEKEFLADPVMTFDGDL